MAQVDLSNKFSKEKPTIKLSDDIILEVNDNHKNVLIVNSLMSDPSLSDAERMEKCMEHLIGQKGVKALEKVDLRFVDYQKVFFGVMAAVNDEPYEEVEKRFRKATK